MTKQIYLQTPWIIRTEGFQWQRQWKDWTIWAVFFLRCASDAICRETIHGDTPHIYIEVFNGITGALLVGQIDKHPFAQKHFILALNPLSLKNDFYPTGITCAVLWWLWETACCIQTHGEYLARSWYVKWFHVILFWKSKAEILLTCQILRLTGEEARACMHTETACSWQL